MSVLAQLRDFTSDNPKKQLIIRFREQTPLQSRDISVRPFGVITNAGEPLLKRQGIASQNSLAIQPDLALLQVNPGQSIEKALEALGRSQDILYVEPNSRIKLFQGSGIVPNDFDFNKLYAMTNSGLRGGKAGADISLTKAWNISTGSSNVVVAVIDTGTDYHHPDLRDNIWVNQMEIAGNGIDDDSNGFVDDIHGYDFHSNDSDPMDDHGHGTHVSGTIGAKGNNRIGVTGVAWDVKMMALKSFDETGNGDLFSALQAIDYAAANGARVINASWGLPGRSRALQETIDAAIEKGVIFVAAAGNDKTDQPSYPAAFPGVISVGATTDQDERAIFSNYGGTVALSAPGQDILSTLPRNSYGYHSGTSMATPHVVGVAALILSQHPEFTPMEVRNILLNTADPIKTDNLLGRGRLNAYRAISTRNRLPKVSILTDELRGQQGVLGTAAGADLKGFGLFYGSTREPKEGWKLLSDGTQPVTNGILAQIDAASLPEGRGVLMLTATNHTGGIATDIREIRVQNVQIQFPLGGDSIRHGKVLPVQGMVLGEGKQYRLSIGKGLKPQAWEKLSEGTYSSATPSQLGLWNTAEVAPDEFYSLKLTAWNNSQTNEHIVSGIYLDSFLKEGFPKHFVTGEGFPSYEWRNFRVADLDKDGKQEIIFVDPPVTEGGPGELVVLNHTGTMKWRASLPGFKGGEIPVVGDLQGAGSLQVFTEADGKLHAFSAIGQPLGGAWPLALNAQFTSKVLADATGDGKLELILYSQETVNIKGFGEHHLLQVVGASGDLQAEWHIPTTFGYFPDQPVFPAVADLDADGTPEIVSVYWNNQIAAFHVGQKDPVWIAGAMGLIVSSPVVGDLDNDGKMEVVVGSAAKAIYQNGGISIFNADGKPRKGWPMLIEQSFTSSPALGDVDHDGILEIAAISQDNYLIHLLQIDGFEMKGWPIENSDSTIHGSLSIADVSGTAAPEVIFASPGYLSLALLDNDPTYVGGVKIWNADGAPANVGSNRYNSFYFEGSSRAEFHKSSGGAVVDLDGDGRSEIVSMSVQERFYGVRGLDNAQTKNRSSLYVWELDHEASASAAWPMPLQNSQNNQVHPGARGQWGLNDSENDRGLTSEDRPLILAVLTNDFGTNIIAGPTIISQLQQPANGTATITANQQLLYSPKTNFNGIDLFSYKYLNQGIESDWIKVEVLVKPINDAPYITNQNLVVNRNSHIDITYAGNDPEGATLNYKIVTPPAHGELWAYPTVGNYYPHKGYSGWDYFGVTTDDGESTSEISYILIQVLPVNNAPRATAQFYVAKMNRSLSLQLRGSDEDGDPLTYRISTPPKTGTLVPEREGSARYIYHPKENSIASDEFYFEANDGQTWSKPEKVTIELTELNSPPAAQETEYQAKHDTRTPIKLQGRDGEGDSLTFAIVRPPLYGTLEGEGANYTYIPATGFSGADRFLFEVSDGITISDPAEVTIHVASANSLPEAFPQSFEGLTNTPVQLKLKIADNDTNILEAIILQGPRHGRIHGAGTTMTYIPDDGFYGEDSFTYLPWDGEDYGEATTAQIVVGPSAPRELPYIESMEKSASGVKMVLQLKPGVTYRIQNSADLKNWNLVEGSINSPTGDYTWESSTMNNLEPQFFRVVEQ